MMNLPENNDFEVLESTENNNPKTEEDETELMKVRTTISFLL